MRIRDLGYSPGHLPTGPKNSVLDVEGVHVGQVTIHEGQDVHTGVTVILPRAPEDISSKPVYAGMHTLNGIGELTGAHQIQEYGWVNTPLAITNSVSVGKVYDAIFLWLLERAKREGKDVLEATDEFGLPVVGETLDVLLNDISKSAVEKHHVFEALDKATSQPEVLEGSYGGGTGMICHELKGGTGTSSRVVKGEKKDYTVGVIVQSNYGRKPDLTIGGVPIGRLLLKEKEKEQESPFGKAGEGSIIIMIFTDAPLLPHQLRRLAQRATVGLSQVASHGAGRNFSGDIFLACSTANVPHERLSGQQPGYQPPIQTFEVETVRNESMDTMFYAVAEATEEAILNALVGARDGLTGFEGRHVDGLPVERVRELLKEYRTWA